jgi:hypothetical protein
MVKVLSNGKGGGVRVVSIDRPLNTLHFRRFLNYLKDPGPLNDKKTFLSGLSTLRGASLNQGASGCTGFFIMPEWGVLIL